MFVIWSFKHGQWWATDRQGYTPHLARAGYYHSGEVGEILQGSIFGESVAILLSTAERMGPPTVPGLWSELPENAEV